MNQTYLCIKSVYGNEHTYGVSSATTYDGQTILIETFPDLCGDRKSVERLADLCNKLHLDAIHLKDVVEDFLAYL